MNELLKIIFTNSVLPVIVAAITAFVTSKLALRQEKKRKVYSQREEIYIEAFELLQHLVDEPCFLFNFDGFIEPLRKLRPKLHLFASQQVINILKPFYAQVYNKYQAYANRFNEEYEMSKAARLERGEKEQDFIYDEDEYIERNKPDSKWLEEIFSDLTLAMRKDVGANWF